MQKFEQKTMKIAAIVVTYNRKQLLEKCLLSISKQSHPVTSIIVVDNNSSDNTYEWFETSSFNTTENTYIHLNENTGGAGGFWHGLKHSTEADYDLAWIMDDDANPELNALEELLKIATSKNNIYGSIAAFGQHTSWPTTVIDTLGNKTLIKEVKKIPNQATVQFLPFLGLLIHKEIISKIGLPKKEFFLAADDVEYCMRAQRNNINIVACSDSIINHPKADTYVVHFLGVQICCLKLSPWKRYYDTRNRLFIAKEYYGYKWITQTIPGSFLRLFATLYKEPERLKQLWAFIAGFVDGILGRAGMRHTHWKIK